MKGFMRVSVGIETTPEEVQALEHAKALKSEPLPAEVEARFARLAEESIRKQKEIEAADRVDFETYRQKYLSPESLRA